MIRLFLTCCCLTIALLRSAVASGLWVQESDSAMVVRTYTSDAVRVYYTEPHPVVVQRLMLPAGTKISQVSVQLSGPPTENAGNLVIFGHERGLIAPQSREPILTIPFAKRIHGIEDVVIPIDPPLVLEGGQTFIGVEGLADSLHLLMVNEATVPCADASGLRSGLVFMDTSGAWRQSALPLALSVSIEYPEAAKGAFALDTVLYGAPDRSRVVAPYVTAGDFNRDGFTDVASAGVIYLSSSGHHVAVDMAGATGYPYLYFADVDGDGYDELLAMQASCSQEIVVWKWSVGSMKRSMSVDLGSCIVPTSMTTIREGRGALVAISGKRNDKHVLVTVGFGSSPRLTSSTDIATSGLMAVDLDADGAQELIIRTASKDEVYKVTSEGVVLFASIDFNEQALALATSSIRNDKNSLAVMLPRTVAWNVEEIRSTSGYADVSKSFQYNTSPRTDERTSALLYADLDNDGVDEAVQFAQGLCRKLFVFKRISANQWQDVTWKFGLDDLYGCTDGLLVDLDKDGQIDLVTDRNGTVEFRYNRMVIPKATSIALQGAPVGVDIRDPKTGDRLAVVCRGRGPMMEDMPFLHLVGDNVPDSIVVQGMIDGQYVVRNVGVNQHRIAEVGQGRDILHVDNANLRSVRMDGSDIIIAGYRNADVDLVISTLTGNVVANMRLTDLSDLHRLSLSHITTSTSLASGTYSLTVRTDVDSRTLVVQLRK